MRKNRRIGVTRKKKVVKRVKRTKKRRKAPKGMPKIFVINLRRDPHKWEKYESDYKRGKLTRFSACNGMEVSRANPYYDKLKMYPTTTEHCNFYYVDSKNYIRELLQSHRERLNLTSKEINEYLGKASNGGGTWSSIAGLRQKTLQEPTKVDWEKLSTLFGGLPKYEDIVYKFNTPTGVTDVFDDINFYDREYRKIKFHPTQKPLKLMNRIIECGTNEGDIVLDFFGGSCSTAVSCKNLNRNFIIGELDSKFCNLGKEWLDNVSNEDNKFF